jgi:hypothetical protein
MGVVIYPDTNEEAGEIIDYMLNAMRCKDTTGADILTNAFQSSSDPKSKQIVHGLSVNTIMHDMKCITVIEEKPRNLETDDGVLCWVENLTAPDCSELGYCFFELHEIRNSHYLKRVG